MRAESLPSGRLLRPFQRGAAMVEFVVVGPLITAMGLAILQYCLMFVAKGQINHATFMAARAGSVAHADIDAIKEAYQRALIPLYGGGQGSGELAKSHAKAVTDLTPANLRIEIVNPTRESFDDYAHDAELNAHYGARAIPHTGIALRPGLGSVGARSGQTLQDANLLKLRITHGYEPKVWLVGMMYRKYLQWLDTGADGFHTQLIAGGRIPVVSHVTLEMHSDAVEQGGDDGRPIFASNPGFGNNGHPIDPGDTSLTNNPPPQCETMGCSVTQTPSDPGATGSLGDGGNGGANAEDSDAGFCQGENCPVCTG